MSVSVSVGHDNSLPQIMRSELNDLKRALTCITNPVHGTATLLEQQQARVDHSLQRCEMMIDGLKRVEHHANSTHHNNCLSRSLAACVGAALVTRAKGGSFPADARSRITTLEAIVTESVRFLVLTHKCYTSITAACIGHAIALMLGESPLAQKKRLCSTGVICPQALLSEAIQTAVNRCGTAQLPVVVPVPQRRSMPYLINGAFPDLPNVVLESVMHMLPAHSLRLLAASSRSLQVRFRSGPLNMT